MTKRSDSSWLGSLGRWYVGDTGIRSEFKQQLRSGIEQGVNSLDPDTVAKQLAGNDGDQTAQDFKGGVTKGITKGISQQLQRDPSLWHNFKYPLAPALLAGFMPGGGVAAGIKAFKQTGGFSTLFGKPFGLTG